MSDNSTINFNAVYGQIGYLQWFAAFNISVFEGNMDGLVNDFSVIGIARSHGHVTARTYQALATVHQWYGYCRSLPQPQPSSSEELPFRAAPYPHAHYFHPMAVATNASHPAPITPSPLSKDAEFETIDSSSKGVQATNGATLGRQSKTITVSEDYWVREEDVQTCNWDRVMTEGSRTITVTTSDDDKWHADNIDLSIDEGNQYLEKDEVLFPTKHDKNGYLRQSNIKRVSWHGKAKQRKFRGKRNISADRGARGTDQNIRTARAASSLMLRCPPPEEWNGENGSITQIMKDLRLKGSNRRKVKSVIEQTYEKYLNGEYYTGKVRPGAGRPCDIERGSMEEQILADGKEDGLSNEDVLGNINDWRTDHDLPLLGKNAVKGALARMAEKGYCDKSSVKKRPDGSDDPNSKWSRARDNFTKQTLIRIGKISLDDLIKEYGKEESISDVFNPKKLSPIDQDGVSFIDETHRDCVVSSYGGKVDHIYKFKRDKDGNFAENGEFDESREGYERTFKHSSQVRLAFSCATRIDSGVKVGHRLPAFDYTGKTMVSRKKWMELEQLAVKDVKLNGGSDKLDSNIGRAAEDALNACGVNNLADIQDMIKNRARRSKVLEDMPKSGNRRVIGPGRLDKIINAVAGVQLSKDEPPPSTDYTKEANPYLARYGEDEWEAEIRKTKHFRGLCCVTDLVEHIVCTTRDFYKGTKNEDNWMFYHDALILMTAKECKDWMAEKGYLKRWILPELGLNEDLGFGGRPVGNSPEFMPWDASLNQDVHESVRRHCVLCRSTLKRQDRLNDDRRFSLATPKLGVATYLRIIDPRPFVGVSPTPKRIVQDIEGAWNAMMIVYQHKGVYVEGLATRTGHRHIKSKEKKNWGGARVKGDHSIAHLKRSTRMHRDLQDMRSEERARTVCETRKALGGSKDISGDIDDEEKEEDLELNMTKPATSSTARKRPATSSTARKRASPDSCVDKTASTQTKKRKTSSKSKQSVARASSESDPEVVGVVDRRSSQQSRAPRFASSAECKSLIKERGRLVNVSDDGNCGYHALKAILVSAGALQDSVAIGQLRRMIKKHAQDNMLKFIGASFNGEDSILKTVSGRLFWPFSCSSRVRDPQRTRQITFEGTIIKGIHEIREDDYEKRSPMSDWLQANFVLPIAVHLFQQSVALYTVMLDESRKRHIILTDIYRYDERNESVSFDRRDGFVQSSPPSGPAPHPIPGEIYSKDTPRQRKLLQRSPESELGRMEAQIALSAWHQESGDCPVVVVVVNVRDYGEKGRYETGPQTNDRASVRLRRAVVCLPIRGLFLSPRCRQFAMFRRWVDCVLHGVSTPRRCGATELDRFFLWISLDPT
ncbi:hypothetical protein THAOC_18686 [Thalassiosira oceanica]|uniref:OTU domain-containing protein n=1 Tax=Thalassiosira oceanica TaxID=159749 RepID=K0SRD6_THAOC|nr:hypothetical protein THAOC_18686 [Thalassiosira oceanica]|eukprot:EJK60897.1 hypothetical protein THAOC_18686 [Thalassiosira oceanica]